MKSFEGKTIFENWVYPFGPETVLPTGVFSLFVPIEGVDATGRSLRECRSVRFRPSEAGYSEARTQDGDTVPINAAAMRHFLEHKPEALRFVASISAQLRSRYPEMHSAVSPASGVFGLVVGYALFKAPAYWLLRNWYGVSADAVPAHVASVSKVGEGLVELLRRVLTSGSDLFDGEGVARAQAIRSSGALKGRVEMCPASNGMIEEFLQAIEDPNSVHPDASKTTDLIERLVDLAVLGWQVEQSAINYAYARLRRIARDKGRDAAASAAKITFLYSAVLPHLVMNAVPMSDSILSTYWLLPTPSSDIDLDESAGDGPSPDDAKRDFVSCAKRFSRILDIELANPQSAIDRCWNDVMGE